MPHAPRVAEFLFNPLEFLNGEQVRSLRPGALGAFTALYCNGWAQPEPGVYPDDDRLLSLLARCEPREWAACRPLVARCFDTASRPGYWVLVDLVQRHARQSENLERARTSGRKGAASRWGAIEQPRLELMPGRPATPDPNGDPIGDPTSYPNGKADGDPVAVLGSVVVGADSKPSNPNTFSLAAWRSQFVSFWEAWPVGHKIDREKCEKLWDRITPHTAETAAGIMAGLERWRASSAWAKADPQTGEAGAFIPHPATWLRNRRWNADAAAPANRSDGVGWARTLEAGKGEGST